VLVGSSNLLPLVAGQPVTATSNDMQNRDHEARRLDTPQLKSSMGMQSHKLIAKTAIDSVDVNASLVAITKNLFPLNRLIESEFGQLAELSKGINAVVARNQSVLLDMGCLAKASKWIADFATLRNAALWPQIDFPKTLTASLKLNVDTFEIVRMSESIRKASEAFILPPHLMTPHWAHNLHQSGVTFDSLFATANPLANKIECLRLATRERFLTSDVLCHLGSSRKPNSDDELRADIVAGIDEDLDDSLNLMLPNVGSSCARMLRGAWMALRSDNPDKIRQALVSARELVNCLLRELAPNAEVCAWSTAKEHVIDGKPTRNGRLSFIYSAVSTGEFKTFICTDITGTVQMINALNRLHEHEPNISDLEMKVMLRKVEGLISTIYELKKHKLEDMYRF